VKPTPRGFRLIRRNDPIAIWLHHLGMNHLQFVVHPDRESLEKLFHRGIAAATAIDTSDSFGSRDVVGGLTFSRFRLAVIAEMPTSSGEACQRVVPAEWNLG
jgi:hypothetical protein